MDSASLNFLTPVLDEIDHWAELAPLLPIIIVLEILLSADNAVALASITRRLRNLDLQRRALNIGISISLLLRIFLLLTANFIIKYQFIKVIASLYLFSLVFKFFFTTTVDTDESLEAEPSSFVSIVSILALTDLAFSIDSVTAAVAISDQILLVVTGTLVGVIALRFTADLFIRWLEEYANLEKAGYIAVSLVAFKLLLQVILSDVTIPDYYFFAIIVIIFTWGFLKMNK